MVLFYRRYSIFSKSVFQHIPDIDLCGRITVRIAMDSDLPQFEEIVTPAVLENFSKRFKKGKICLIALDEDKIIYYSWISFEQEIFIRIKDKEAYFFNSFTLPKYRRMGIHTKAIIECLKIIKQKGCEKALLIISLDNFVSIRAIKKIGFEESGWASYLYIPLLKMRYYAVIRKEAGRIVNQYRSFGSNYRRLNLYLLMLQKIIVSYFPKVR